MKLKSIKKIASLIITMIMVISMSINVFAKEAETQSIEEAETQSEKETEVQSEEETEVQSKEETEVQSEEETEVQSTEETEMQSEEETEVQSKEETEVQSAEEAEVHGMDAKVRASISASKNYTFATATNVGRWSKTTNVFGVIDEEHKSAFVKFITSPGDRLYVRESYDKSFEGMGITLYNGNEMSIAQGNKVVNPSSIIPFVFVNCDGGTDSQTFYVKIDRPENSTGKLYYSINFYERIKTGSINLKFSGKASKAKNAKTSSTINLSTTSNSKIPTGAIVTSLSTSATMSPGQGWVTHTLTNNGTPYNSNSSYQGSGSWTYITAEQEIPAKAEWGFNYATKATGASIMTNVSMLMDYQYDITDTFSYQ